MIQFTKAEIKKIRERSALYPATLQKLKADVETVFQDEIRVPETGIGNWTHYYYCPKCSVRLNFDRHDPNHHFCPSCGQDFTGEPYDSAWWGMINAQNVAAAYSMAVIWLITGDDAYARKASDILLAYARYYPQYEPHGNIPYNGPGRVGAQTLDEANFQRHAVMAFDILTDFMTDDETAYIRDRMLLPAAEFLMDHRVKQVHNHEVFTNSAIAMIGILFDKKDLIDAALNDKYGIIYLLEHGVQKNGMWFEGSFGYHFYALEGFFLLEKLALHTPYSHIHHPLYKKMLDILADYLEPDGGIPMLNDTNFAHLDNTKLLYEFPYRVLGGKRLAYILNTYYKKNVRDNQEALLYGADSIEETDFKPAVFHTPAGESGHTIFRSEKQYLLFKHDAYGGEHDHYDRLDLSWTACGRGISRDLGTTGYGANLHYGYYKNTGSHNTVVLGEENHAPVNAVLTDFRKAEDGILYASAVADWRKPYQLPDSFVIRQWSDENYKDVKMTRKVAFTPDYFVEFFEVEGISPDLTADWVWHFSGEMTGNREGTTLPDEYFTKKPFCELTFGKEQTITKTGKTWKRQYIDEDVLTAVYGLDDDFSLITALGPDNPSTRQISYLIERRKGVTRFMTSHVFESWQAESMPVVETVQFTADAAGMSVRIQEKGGKVRMIRF